MDFIYDDGGRKVAGFKGDAGDCVTRSIAIAMRHIGLGPAAIAIGCTKAMDYADVYRELSFEQKEHARRGRKRHSKSARTGVVKKVYEPYLLALGWTWVPTMMIGSGCRVHLTDGELPMGCLLVCVSKHMTCLIDGVIHDIFDPQRETIYDDGRVAQRCVYGYFSHE